jgi:pimeloyl-ACP methyl ester carboxylesterase
VTATNKFVVSGTGPYLIFLNGTYQTVDSWGALAKGLSSHYTVVRFNFPGQGQDDERSPCTDFKALCVFALECLNELPCELEGMTIFGLSMGAQIAHALATDHGVRFKRVILAGYMPATMARFKKFYFATLKRVLKTEGVDAFSNMLCFTVFSPYLFEKYAGGYEFIVNSFRLQYGNRIDTLMNLLDLSLDSASWLPTRDSVSPLTFIYGGHDSLVPVKVAYRFAAHCKSPVIFVDEAGHSFPVEAVPETVSVIKAVLNPPIHEQELIT